jgi:hypothetical protein
MNTAFLEIRNRFGEKLLARIVQDFPAGFQIIGGDDTLVIVGDREQNRAYSRKTHSVKEIYRFPSPQALRRG